MFQSRFEADFTIEKLELVLGSIRQDLLSSSIIPWLRDDFIPFVVKVLPQGQVSISFGLYHGVATDLLELMKASERFV